MKYILIALALFLGTAYFVQAAPFSWDYISGSNIVRLIAPQNTATVQVPALTSTATATLATSTGAVIVSPNETTWAKLGVGTSSPTEILHLSRPSWGYTTTRFDSGTTQGQFYAYGGDNTVAFGSRSVSPVNLIYGDSVRATLYGPNASSTILDLKSPSATGESTFTTTLPLGGSNREFIDWTLENYGTDHFGSINIAKQGTGTIRPFGIRFWNSDLGPIHENGVFQFLTYPTGHTAIGNYSSTTGNAVPAILRVGSSTTGSLFRVDNGSSTPYFTVSSTGASTSALTISGLSDGCLNITARVVGSTGSACGSGGGGGLTTWLPGTGYLYTATSTDGALAAYFSATSTTATSTIAGAVNIGSATTAARFGLRNILSQDTLLIEDQASDATPFRIDQSGQVTTGGTITVGGNVNAYHGGTPGTGLFSFFQSDGSTGAFWGAINSTFQRLGIDGSPIVLNGRTGSTGNVGVGTTTTPTFKLQVVSQNTNNIFRAASSTGASILDVLGTGVVQVTGTTTTSNLSIGSLTGFLKATAGNVATSLVNLASDVTGFLGITNGGTGTSTAPTTDQILVGNAAGSYDYRRIVAGSNVSVSTSTAGQIQISATGGGSGGSATSSYRATFPYKSRLSPQTVISNMDSGWTAFYATGSIAVDTTNYVQGTSSYVITAGTGGGTTGIRNNITDFDGSASNYTFWVRADNWTNIATAQLLLSTNGVYTDFYSVDLKSFLVSPPNNEWIEIIVPRSNFTANGSPTWTTVNDALFRITGTAGNAPNLWVDDFALFQSATKGMVTISFDDGDVTAYTTAKPIMDKYKFVGIQYVIWDAVGTGGTFMSQSQVDEFHRSGWDIGGHGGTNLTTLTASQIDTDVSSMRNYLLERGYRGADHYALPNGAYSSTTIPIVSKYFSTQRTIDSFANSQNYVAPRRISAFSVSQFTSTSTIFAKIDQARTNGDHLILTFHKIVTTPALDTEWSTERFSATMDYLAASGLPVVPMSEAMQTDYDNLRYINGRIGIGTTTASSTFAVQAANIGQKIAQFFNSFGSSTLEISTATSSVTHNSTLSGFAQELRARITIGINSAVGYYRSGKLFGALTISGLFFQEDWNQVDCSQLVGATQIVADGLTGCDGFAFYEDGTETLTSGTQGGLVYARLSTSLTAGGAGVFVNAPSTGAFIFGTSTPKLEVVARLHTMQNWATSTRAYIGFTNIAAAGTTYEIEPTVGCYFTASSSASNWLAVCRTSAAAQTVVDTGVASTTAAGTGDGRPYRFFLEADSLEARFYIQSTQAGNLTQVAGITSNVPTTVALNAGAHFGSPTGIVARGIDIYDMNFGWRKALR